MPLENLQHWGELAVAAVSGFGGAWARERYRKPKAAAEAVVSRKELSDVSARLFAIERRADASEWDIRQMKSDHDGLSGTLKELGVGLQEVNVKLARIEALLEDRA